jgi:hypothetical protein
MATHDHAWGDAGARWMVGGAIVFPVALSLLFKLLPTWPTELRINEDLIEVTARGRCFRFLWTDVAQVEVRRIQTLPGAVETYGVHVRLQPGAEGPPHIRTDVDGWIPIWGPAKTAEITPELRQALERFAGTRWEDPWV